MSEFRENSILVNFLRITAILGTLGVGVFKIFTAPRLEPNQYYSLYALAVIAVAFCVLLFGFLPRAAARLLKDPDVLVPLGLYVTAQSIFSLLVQTSTFVWYKGGTFDLGGLTVMVVVSWLVQLALGIGFIGWTTSVLLQLVRSGQVDLVRTAKDVRWWFPRTLSVAFFVCVPAYLLLGLFLLPALMTKNPWAMMGITYPFIVVLGVVSLVWNLATAALIPYVLSTRVGLLRAMREGLQVSWVSKWKTILPVTLVMLLAGWLVILSVTYSETKVAREETDGGSLTTTTTETKNFKSKYTTHFIWAGGYPEDSKWHGDLMQMVERKPLPSVDFRIMLLLLLFSVAVNLQIILALPRADEPAVDPLETEIPPNYVPGAALFALLLICVIPFEYLIGGKYGIAELAESKAPAELIVPKVYTGEGVFDRTELFRYEKTAEEKAIPMVYPLTDGEGKRFEPDPDELEMNRIEQVYAGEVDDEPGADILVAGSRSAFLLSSEGKLKKEIDYHLGRYLDGEIPQDRHMAMIEFVDLDRDGTPEIAGRGPYVCEVIDLTGKVVWKYPGKAKGNLWRIDQLKIGDVDNDGINEILVGKDDSLEVFDRQGRLLWKSQVPKFSLTNLTVADFDQDGWNEIITDDSIYNGRGELVRSIKKPIRVNGHIVGNGEPLEMIFFDKNKLGLFQLENLTATYEAPMSFIDGPPGEKGPLDFGALVFHARGQYVYLSTDGRRYLAILADATVRKGRDYCKILYVYDSDRKLIYHETFDAFNGVLSVLRDGQRPDSLLVTDDGKLFKYSLH